MFSANSGPLVVSETGSAEGKVVEGTVVCEQKYRVRGLVPKMEISKQLRDFFFNYVLKENKYGMLRIILKYKIE